jgi:hypothetical protein
VKDQGIWRMTAFHNTAVRHERAAVRATASEPGHDQSQCPDEIDVEPRAPQEPHSQLLENNEGYQRCDNQIPGSMEARREQRRPALFPAMW